MFGFRINHRSDEARVRKVNFCLTSDRFRIESCAHATHLGEQLDAAELERFGEAGREATVRVGAAQLVGAEVIVDWVRDAPQNLSLTQSTLGFHAAMDPEGHWLHQVLDARDPRGKVRAITALTLAAAPEPAELRLP